MIINTKFGAFELIKNYREAFLEEAFLNRYIEETFDQYTYIVGDVSSSILRLKGFTEEGPQSYHKIPDYLNESCNMNTAYYILKRVELDETLKEDQS